MVYLTPFFFFWRGGVISTVRRLVGFPAARVAARVDYARVLGKFPVPVDAGREDLAADAHGFFVGGWLHAMVSRRRRGEAALARRANHNAGGGNA